MRPNVSELPTRTCSEFSLSRLLKTGFEPKPGQRIGILIDLADPKRIEGFVFLKDAALTIQRHAHDVFCQGLKNGVTAELVDRLRDPGRCLAALPAVVRPGGQLLLTTPCTWLEERTAQTDCLGGFAREGRPVRTLETLQALLDSHFILARTLDLPFLMRDHARKFQWSAAQATVWIRR